MNKKNKIIISLIIIVMMMLLLFHSSNESYEQQSLISTLDTQFNNQPFKALLSHIHFNYAGQLISIESLGYSHFIEFFIRKFAHFMSYFIIGSFSYCLLKQLISKLILLIILSWSIPVIYAIIDEIHQSFTPGRTPLWQDVVLDSIGALVGIICCFILLKYRKRNI